MLSQSHAEKLTSLLGLGTPPVGLAFVNEAPAGVSRTTRQVPSACTFWKDARNEVIYAEAPDHSECPIGVLTMGFELTKEQEPGAMQLIQTMCDLKYFSMDEVAALPKVTKPHRGIVYGPLADLPVAPDSVLVIVNPYQSMLMAEAAGNTSLTKRGGQSAFGRPACAVIPQAIDHVEVMLSLGCIGARTYVGLDDNEGVVVIPGPVLEATVDRLTEIVEANRQLAAFHTERRRAIAGA